MKRAIAEKGPGASLEFPTLLSRCGALSVLVTALLLLVLPTAALATQKTVLILSGGRGRVSINQMESTLRAHLSEPVSFSIVDLENSRFEQKAYQDNLAEGSSSRLCRRKTGSRGRRDDLATSIRSAIP